MIAKTKPDTEVYDYGGAPSPSAATLREELGITPTPDKPRDGWINTYTGRQVFPLDLTEDQVSFRDVVQALKGKRRFQGASEVSVAAHSVAVARVFAEMGGKNVLKALMHDANEAYLPDVPHPLKVQPQMAWYREIEKHHELVIDKKLGIGAMTEKDAKLLRDIDRAAAWVEAGIFLNRHRDFAVPRVALKITDLLHRELLCARATHLEIWAKELGVKG